MTAMRLESSTRSSSQQRFLHRRRIGPVALATVGLLAVFRLRGSCESLLSIGLEVAVQLGLIGLWWFQCKATSSTGPKALANRGRYLVVFAVAMIFAPWLLQASWRLLGQGTGLELVAMSSFAWPTLLAAIAAERRRALGTTVVCSGFVTLLATCSSDQSVALLFAFVWGGFCLWWLASAHWERAQRCQVNTVVANRWQRPLTVLAGCGVFAVSAWSVAGRFPSAQQLPWQIAPTSGGTDTNDPFANGGVGDGDALVAAREHAASFGAVDSDLMLDSKEASLFDLYSDTFGEPVRKQDTERTVALAPQPESMAEPNQMAQSDGASSALTTQRRPSQANKPVTNRASDALLFWIGRADSHLALERFTDFDGIQWSPDRSAAQADTAERRVVQPNPAAGNQTWFTLRPSGLLTRVDASPYQGALAEAVKYARLKSPRIPSLAGMHSWRIHQVDDPSFFHVDDNDNLTMTGRKSVPEYTVVRYVNREIDLQTLVQTLRDKSVNQVPSVKLTGDIDETRGQLLARTIVGKLVGSLNVDGQPKRESLQSQSPSWDTVSLVIAHLRREYRLDRSQDTSAFADPLAEFLERRAGNDLMFATAAAVMLRELGYETRLVTGFVARAKNRLGWTKEIAIYGPDTHAWLEVQAGTGNWIPLEPTPTYPLPIYRVSWRYWLQLVAWRMAFVLSLIMVAAAVIYRCRTTLFDVVCRLASLLCWIGNDRQRCRWLLTILDCRCRLVGIARPSHVSPQRWYAVLSRTDMGCVSQSTTVFFREADRLWFGRESTLSHAGRAACLTLWTKSNCRMLRDVMHPSRSSTSQP